MSNSKWKCYLTVFYKRTEHSKSILVIGLDKIYEKKLMNKMFSFSKFTNIKSFYRTRVNISSWFRSSQPFIHRVDFFRNEHGLNGIVWHKTQCNAIPYDVLQSISFWQFWCCCFLGVWSICEASEPCTSIIRAEMIKMQGFGELLSDIAELPKLSAFFGLAAHCHRWYDLYRKVAHNTLSYLKIEKYIWRYTVFECICILPYAFFICKYGNAKF